MLKTVISQLQVKVVLNMASSYTIAFEKYTVNKTRPGGEIELSGFVSENNSLFLDKSKWQKSYIFPQTKIL